MNGVFSLLGRSLRGMRLAEFAAYIVLFAMVLGVYLAKASAGRERGDIAAVQSQIEAEQRQVRMLQAEVAHLEEPRNIERLATMAGLAPTGAQREARPEQLGQIAASGVSGPNPLVFAAAAAGARQ